MNVLRLTLRQLQIFVAVARSGSTTLASSEIALSQSATSSAVNELERLLSMRLFDRAGKRLLLNDNGRALLPRALALLDGAADIERMALGSQAQMQALRVGASTTIGNYVLPRLLADSLAGVQDTSSAWQSSVRIGNTAEICDAVAAFELDVGLVEGPSHQGALELAPWLNDPLVIVAAPGSELARACAGPRAQPASPERLREQIWLLREPGSGTRETSDLALLPHLGSYRRSIEIASSEAIKHAVAQGLGVTCLSSWVVDDLIAAGRLVRIATTVPPLARQFYLVVHRSKQPTAALRAFVGRVMSFAAQEGAAAAASPARPSL